MLTNRFFLCISISFICLNSCKKEDQESTLPDCFEQKLVAFDLQGSCPTNAKIEEYAFRGERVYALDPGNCSADLSTEIVDEMCNSLGFIGGISGNYTINGHDFNDAQFVKTHWEN